MTTRMKPHAGGALGAPLSRYRETVSSALRGCAPAPESLVGRIVGDHMGWWDSQGRPRPAVAGKLFRPCLCLWACEACGGSVESALPVACAIELAHNFTLVHDDIQDGDRERRSRPTVWSIWGVAEGINAGDALQILSMRQFTEAGRLPERRLQLTLERAGRLLGLAFQLRDDWLGVWGDPALTGKSCNGDLARRKQTYPVVAAAATASPTQRAELRSLYRRGEAGSAQRLRELLEQLGGPQLTESAAEAPAAAAVAAVRSSALRPDRVEEFADVARYVATRNS